MSLIPYRVSNIYVHMSLIPYRVSNIYQHMSLIPYRVSKIYVHYFQCFKLRAILCHKLHARQRQLLKCGSWLRHCRSHSYMRDRGNCGSCFGNADAIYAHANTCLFTYPCPCTYMPMHIHAYAHTCLYAYTHAHALHTHMHVQLLPLAPTGASTAHMVAGPQ